MPLLAWSRSTTPGYGGFWIINVYKARKEQDYSGVTRFGVDETSSKKGHNYISIFDNAEITFDKFHVVKVLNAAVDEVRRQEQKERPELKKTRWVWQKNEKNQTDKEYEIFESLKNMNWRTVRATHLKINFQELYSQPKEVAEKFLKKWYFWATHCRIQPMIDAAKARARGFRSTKNFITMVYIIARKLDFRLPT